MDVKKAIKKVIALGAGATMVGATLMGAMAADLSDYPSMFVKDGKFNAIIVVGDDAAAKDVVGSIDIATSLQYSLKTTKTVSVEGGSSSVSLEGDSFKFETSSKKLELSEQLNDVQSVIDGGDLEALKDSSFRTGKNTADYEQQLEFMGNVDLVYEEDTDNDKVSTYLNVDNNENIALYTMTFKTTANSDIDTTKTSQLEDFKDKKLMIMGKEFTITKSTFSGTTVELTMMGGAIMDTISEGETKTYTLDGKDYEVENVIVTDSGTIYTQLKINGEVTEKMEEGDTYTLADGIDIGIKTLLNNEAGDVTGDLCEFYLGADKLVIKDQTVTTATVDGTMDVAEEKMDEVEIGIKGTNDSSEFQLETIKFNYTSDDDYWFGPGEKLSEKLEEPEGLINWDLAYEGLSDASTEGIVLKSSGDKRMIMEVELEDGQVDIPLAYSSNETEVYLGDSNDKLILARTTSLSKDQYFFLTAGTAGAVPGEDDKSYLLQYRGADSSTGDSTATVKFKNMATSDTIERTFSIGAAAGTATLNLGGTQFTVANTSDATAGQDDFTVSVTGGSANNYLVTAGNALVLIKDNDEAFNTNSTGVNQAIYQLYVNITEADDDNMNENDLLQSVIALSFDDGNDASEINMDDPVVYINGVVVDMISDPDDSDVTTYQTAYGADLTFTEMTSSPNKLEINWPHAQLVGQAFVTSGAVSSTETGAGSSGTIETTEIVKIQVGIAQLASAVRGQEKSQNLILVGGPCINEAAAVVTGWPFVNGQPQYGSDKCGMGLEAGKAKLKIYQNGDYVAMLVAGFAAEDTKRATTVVANYEDYADSLMGMEVEVSGTSMSDISVSKVEAKVVVEEVAE